MAISTLKGATVEARIWTPLHEIESAALDQIRNVASLPWCFHHVAIMPDNHWGQGCTVGTVAALKNAVSPCMVGVDIGCGMGAVKTNIKANDLPESLRPIRLALEKAIPVNHHGHGDPVKGVQTLQLWRRFRDLSEKVQDKQGTAMSQCGTLGGGNHFVELCLDTTDTVWMMLHSGSRNIGKVLAEIHIAKAKKLAHNAELPDKDLSVFLAGTPEMDAYRHDLYWAQEYALANRKVMFEIYKGIMRKFFPNIEYGEAVYCHHNYVAEETHYGEEVFVTRKGAIRANVGDMGIIPGAMGKKSYIVEGLGNPESFCSASHGAGRKMSRGKAKKTFTVADIEEQTKGVECRKDQGVLDEIPGCYKDLDQVMANQADLVKVHAELRAIMTMKGGEKE
jgi:tRNA-splicing ligase RtcB